LSFATFAPRARRQLAALTVVLLLAPHSADAATRHRHGTASAGGALSRSEPSAPVPAGSSNFEPDPLAANGFASPACSTAELYAQISAAARTDCRISGVAVAPVPLSNYAFDTNVASGLDASFVDDVKSIVQDLLVTPVWTAIVWLVHVVVVALEWCYAIDLLAPKTLGAVVQALSSAERIFTEPWLGLALAMAGVAFAYNGLVRRRVSETLGQAVLMAAMIAVGLWIIADPVNTVGAVSHLADEAALGTVAATTTGNADQPTGSLDTALSGVFDSAITGPWCYLEFGDVDWCRDPSRLDPSLVGTARALERLYGTGATCHSSPPGLVFCGSAGSAEQRFYADTAIALSAARTNGALFLALPADGLTRDALSSQTSLPTLYGTLCGGSDPTACTAGTAPQAEFRTAEGTWPRVGGLLLIAIGTAGMLAMLGFIALRLLGSAIAVLVYLLLAPLAVLAPAFGDGGRDTFRVWLTRLVGAALAKLVYSVMLGVTLLVARLLMSINQFGWWTQWLLFSAFWWLAFEHRHRMLAFVVHERGEQTSRLPLVTRLRYGGQLAGSVKRTGRAFGHLAETSFFGAADVWRQARTFPSGSVGSEPSSPRHSPSGRDVRGRHDSQARASFSAGRVESAPQAEALHAGLDALRDRRAGLAREEQVARRSGDARRAASLASRAQALDEQIARYRDELPVRGHGGPRLGTGSVRAERRWSAELNRAARVPSRPRDYASLARLAGLSSRDFEGAPAAARLRARLEIDRQLAQRRVWLERTGTRGPLASVVPRIGRSAGVGEPDRAGRRERQFGFRLR